MTSVVGRINGRVERSQGFPLKCTAASVKFHSGRKRRDVPFKPILGIELLIVAKIEEHSSMHYPRDATIEELLRLAGVSFSRWCAAASRSKR
jgi:hypothetical protein